MADAISQVKTGQVTYAVRDTSIDGVEIQKDDYMGIGDKGILSNGKDIDEVILKMLDKMVDDSAELITVYFGADVKEDAASAIVDKVKDKYQALEVDMQKGGQPVYYYIVSVE